MPTCVLERPGGRFGAQIMSGGEMLWLGTRGSREEAQALVDAARAKRGPQQARKVPQKRRSQPRRVVPPTVEEVERIAAYMEGRRPLLGAFIWVAASSGLRLSEVAALEWRDVQVRDGVTWLHVRKGKGSKEAWSVLGPRGVAAVDGLVSTRAARQPLFITREGTLFSRQRINRYWQDMRAALPETQKWIFHDLRKHHATWLLDQGAQPMDVAAQLRHIDRQGRPNIRLVQSTYGFPDLSKSLERVAGVMA